MLKLYLDAECLCVCYRLSVTWKKVWRWGSGCCLGSWPRRKHISVTWRHCCWWEHTHTHTHDARYYYLIARQHENQYGEEVFYSSYGFQAFRHRFSRETIAFFYDVTVDESSKREWSMVTEYNFPYSQAFAFAPVPRVCQASATSLENVNHTLLEMSVCIYLSFFNEQSRFSYHV